MEIGKRLLAFLMLLGSVLTTAALTGCNTIEGVGRDVEAAGDAIADEAEDERDD